MNHPLRPHIGGGLGLALNYTGYDCQLPNGSTYSFDDRQTNFAHLPGTRVLALPITSMKTSRLMPHIALWAWGYNEVFHPQLTGTKYEIGNEPYSNEFMLGLRFTF